MKIVWSPRARRHLEDLFTFIAADNEEAAAATVRRIVRLVREQLAAAPPSGRPGRVTGTRELVVPRTRYLVAFRVRGERLEVLAVLHGARRWPDRL